MMHDDHCAASDSVAIIRGHYKFKRALEANFSGVVPTSCVSVLTEASASYAHLGLGYMLLRAV